MNFHFCKHLACPIDGLTLELKDRQLFCPEGHSFDIARQGYVNLLPVQFKRSTDPGDSREMVAARTQLLDSGCYERISTTLNELVAEQYDKQPDIRLLDAGCGEGYYLQRLKNSLPDTSCIGIDISKPAILAACKRSREITWIVGTNKKLPVTAHSLDAVLCLFGFPVWPEFARALNTGGKVIMLDPGPDHLIELREILYAEVRRHEPADLSKATEHGLNPCTEQSLTFQSNVLSQEQIRDLLSMTPHLYRAPETGKARAFALDKLVVTIDIRFRVLEKTA
jgi:23S rRNA (guanine745-N1)-methyltransferase